MWLANRPQKNRVAGGMLWSTTETRDPKPMFFTSSKAQGVKHFLHSQMHFQGGIGGKAKSFQKAEW